MIGLVIGMLIVAGVSWFGVLMSDKKHLSYAVLVAAVMLSLTALVIAGK